MSPPQSDAARHPDVVLVRLSGEISTKARPTRNRFVDRLQAGIADALRAEAIPARVRRHHDRLLVECDGEAAAPVLARIFGIQSLAVSRPLPADDCATLVRHGVERFRERVAGRRFAVRARRVGDRTQIPLRSQDLARELGTALLPGSAGVDLDHPEVSVHVELFGAEAYFFDRNHPAPGGLPLGSEGRAVALVSGGFDSAVAVWQMSRRGVQQDYVFCNLGGEAHQLGVLRVMKLLADRWSYGTRPRLHAVDFQAVAAALRERTETRYWQVLLKREMLRAAEAIAGQSRAIALVTGDAVGQVSSQTLQNLAVISQATELPILRPLVGTNKDEIIGLAERIGTAPLSAVVQEYCAMVPRKPATAARAEAVAIQEARLDPAVLARALAERAVFELRDLDLDALGIPELEIDHLPEGATLLDLRSRNAYDAWHHPDALHLDFSRALQAYAAFDPEPDYVLYCEFGLKSAHLAEVMRKGGFRAHHWKGGMKRLVAVAAEQQRGDLRVDLPVLLDPEESSR